MSPPITKAEVLATFGDVGFATIREQLQSAIGNSDVSLLLNQTGLRAKLAKAAMEHPQGAAVGIDVLTTLVGRMASHYNPLLGKTVDELGEGVAYGLRDLAQEARNGTAITAGNVETALQQADKTMAVIKEQRSAKLAELHVGQRRAFFALLLASREEEHFDNTPAWALDPLAARRRRHGQRGFRGLEGRAFQTEAGLLWLLETDIEMLKQVLPSDKSFDQVYYYPSRCCQEAITAATTCKSMPMQKALDVIDLMVDKEDLKQRAGRTAGWILDTARSAATTALIAYPVFMIVMFALFFTAAIISLVCHATLLFAPTAPTWAVVTIILAYLALLLFRYTFTLVDTFHAFVGWLVQRLDVTREDALVGTIARGLLGIFGKEDLLKQTPRGEKREYSWAVHFAGTAFIAATALAALTVLHYFMGRGIGPAFIIILTELLILLAVELPRRMSALIPHSDKIQDARWMRKWVTRGAVTLIVLTAIISIVGWNTTSWLVSQVRSEQVTNPAEAGAPEHSSPKLERACAHCREHDGCSDVLKAKCGL